MPASATPRPPRKPGRPLKLMEGQSGVERFAQELRRWRTDDVNLSQDQLARLTVYSRGYIGQIERAEKLPESLFVERCCEAAGASSFLRERFAAATAESQTMQHQRHRNRRSGDAANSADRRLQAQALQFAPFQCPAAAEAAIDAGAATDIALGTRGHHVAQVAFDDEIVFAAPFGSVLLHRSTNIETASITDAAIWQRTSYEQLIETSHKHVHDLLGVDCQTELPTADYAFTVYFVLAANFGTTAATRAAVRLLSVPSLLEPAETPADADPEADRRAAIATESDLIVRGLEHVELIDFGLSSLSIGSASWDDVAYLPLAPQRALTAKHFIDVEVRVQLLWNYAFHILNGTADTHSTTTYNARFVRAALSQISVAGAQESTQHFLMREAIVRSSRVDPMLEHAIEALRADDLESGTR